MARGIINPYYKPPPKRDRPPIYDREWSDTEDEIGIRPVRTRLSGDKFVIEFTGIEFEDLQDELVTLVLDVSQKFSKELRQYGIKMGDSPDKDEMTLQTKKGALTVFVGNVPNENTIVNRIGHALTRLPVKSILEKHRVAIIARG